ncbi:MAG: type II toxin-antitoxin system PemK/MazF family toxin [Candidatus Diapherotrites archaeon]
MNSSIIEQGELVVADILFAEQVGAKRRLALVMSNSEYNKKSEDIIVLKVTSQGSNTEYDINFSNENTLKKALKKDSTIMVDFPTVIMKERIISIPDKVSRETLVQVKQKMKELYML